MKPDFLTAAESFPPIRTMDDIEAIEKTPWSSYHFPDSTLEMIEASVQRRPEAVALRFLPTAENGEEGVCYSYRQFGERIRQAANAFIALGVGPEDVVSFMLPNLPQTHFTLWGGQAAGITNAVNPMLEPEHIAGILNGAGTKVLVALAPMPGADIWDKVVAIRDQVPSLQKVLYVDPCQFLPEAQAQAIRAALPLPVEDWCEDFDRLAGAQVSERVLSDRVIKPEDTASLFHTGGTTGVPKLAPHSHGNEVTNALMTAAAFQFNSDDVVLCGLPLFHVNAVIITGLGPLATGAEIVLATAGGFRTPGLVGRFWKLVEQHRVSFFSAVPAIYAGLLQVPFGDADVSSLKKSLSGGAALPKAVHERFEQLTGLVVVEGFGMTEGTCGSMLNPMAGERRSGSVGFRLPYTGARVVQLDEHGAYQRDCDTDEVGTLIISGPNVFAGYTDPEKNRDIWVQEGWFNTGDLARIDREGYFWLTGRSKDLIIRGGHNIDPQMIEDVLHQHPAVDMAAAVGKPCDRVGELPVAYVSLRAGTECTEAELLAFCDERIAERAAIPKNIWIIDAIPLTAVGKIFKPSLRLDAIERELTRVVSEELGGQTFSLRATSCKHHGQRVDVTLGESDRAGVGALTARLQAYPVHVEVHLAAESAGS
ncbi:acyl-CoA synthetase [Marinobacter zhejiangensis]|uniref:Fatty-acyl-CoA synthase n=1 Tax=Marinobacter zhejiangensis TaxID=488535 RepID=A0A1I4PY68_9GAMM|nr:acyl-CoA synthetase [Marinobacter zhejiangensis]SFM32768.1 fatty-acyl-CoA synthase [Marinobacter zhejiangensis]